MKLSAQESMEKYIGPLTMLTKNSMLLKLFPSPSLDKTRNLKNAL